MNMRYVLFLKSCNSTDGRKVGAKLQQTKWVISTRILWWKLFFLTTVEIMGTIYPYGQLIRLKIGDELNPYIMQID